MRTGKSSELTPTGGPGRGAGMREAAWLLAAAVVTLFHDPYTDRFDADRLLLLRALALVALIAWATARIADFGGLRKRWLPTHPLLLPVLGLGGSYLLATALSLAPAVSWWGDLPRLHGAASVLAILGLVLVAAPLLGDRRRRDRLMLALAVASAGLCLYAMVQWLGWDPRVWVTVWHRQVIATQGNPIFLGALIGLVIPLSLSRVLHEVPQRRWAPAAGWSVLVALQVLTLTATRSRGPLVACAGGLWLGATVLAMVRGRRRLALGSFALAGAAAVGLLLLVLTAGPGPDSQTVPGEPAASRSATAGQRLLTWRGTAAMLRGTPGRVVAGFGPEMMDKVFPPWVPPQLPGMHWQPDPYYDRAHNAVFDRLIETGLVGTGCYLLALGVVLALLLRRLGLVPDGAWKGRLVALLAAVPVVLGVAAWALSPGHALVGPALGVGLLAAVVLYALAFTWRGLRAASAPEEQPLFTAAVVAAVAGHVLESQVGFATAAGETVFWLLAAAAVAPPVASTPTGKTTEEESAFAVVPAAGLLTAVLSLLIFALWTPPQEGSRLQPGLDLVLAGTWVLGTWLLAAGHPRRRFLASFAPLTLGWTALYALGHGELLAREAGPDPLLRLLLVQLAATFAAMAYRGRSSQRSLRRWRRVPLVVLIAALGGWAIHLSSLRWLTAAHALSAGRAASAAGRHDVARQDFERAVEIVPELDGHHLALARSRIREAAAIRESGRRDRRLQAVAEELEAGRRRRPHELGYLKELAYLHTRWGELSPPGDERRRHWQQASDHYAAAARRAPHDALIRRNRGWLLLVMGEVGPAVAELERAAELSPRSVEGHLALARAYLEQLRTEKARQAIARAAEVDPERTLRLAAEVARAQPADWRALRDLALVYAILGERRRAIRAAEAALEAAQAQGPTAFAQVNASLEGALRGLR